MQNTTVQTAPPVMSGSSLKTVAAAFIFGLRNSAQLQKSVNITVCAIKHTRTKEYMEKKNSGDV